MGRKRGEKMYVTASEWLYSGGGKSAENQGKLGAAGAFKALPFHACALSLQPFEDPVATPDGTVFDILNVVPYIQKHKKNPATGEPMTTKDLIRLHFHKNTEDQYIDPVTYKVLTNHTHIVFIRTSGQVYAMETIETLNIKPGNWTDLVTGEKFTKKDIVPIQDPLNLHKRNVSGMFFYRQGHEAIEKQRESGALANINLNEATTRIFSEMGSSKDDGQGQATKKRRLESGAAAVQKPKAKKEEEEEGEERPYIAAASFTCAGFSSKPQPKLVNLKQTKKKGLVRLHTSAGDINLELHCDLVPKTTENFLLLCERGYYDNVIFHRLIPKFMVQGGDPTGTGTGGKSAWDNKFPDEIVPKLIHDKRGVLSMANAGPNSNGSQFFITFGPTPHLNGKHTVFGRVVGGFEALDIMETFPVDKSDKPTIELKIAHTTVFVNPFDADAMQQEQEGEEKKELELKKKRADETERGAWFSNPNPLRPDKHKDGVGKYIAGGGDKPSSQTTTTTASNQATGTTPKVPLVLSRVTNEARERGKAQRAPGQFDFGGW